MTPPQAHPLDEALRAALREVLPQATLAWLHGSAVRDALRPDSDLDVAVWLPQPLPAERWLQAAAVLSERLGREVDLLDLTRAPTVTQFIVLSSARLLLAHDERDAWRLWARVLRDWQDLQPARRAALRALATELQEAAA
ncbi:MAG: nucleotidyltransferase domain-containing protein [Burkholderiaceae bacterium]|nr:nucleotidyltransferase domain-containing protein [Burkholderiaceae bacterium]